MRNMIRLCWVLIWVGVLFLLGLTALHASTDITSPNFTIPVWTFWSTELIDDDTAWGTINNVLMTVLEKLILVFGACAIFIMTIWAGYMIIYHGQDEFLSKWKSIFMSWIIALVVALSAWIIVRLFTFLLY